MEIPNTRGFRNCNPANIRHGSSKWLGMKRQQNDKSFVQFTSMSYGCRALVVLLRNYYFNYQLNTIRKIVTRFAPPSENDSEAYIDFVSKISGIDADHILAAPNSESGRTDLSVIARSIIAYENGTLICAPYFYGLAYYWFFVLS